MFQEYDEKGEEIIFESEEMSVSTIVMNHRIPTCGFLFHEKNHPRKILAEKLEEFNIPISAIADLKKGNDFVANGKTIPNSELTGEPSPIRSYAFCSDTLYNEKIIPQVEGADLMYHESTFMNESSERAIQTFH